MKKHKFGCILLPAVLVLAVILALPAAADIGPKPSVAVRIKGLEGQRYAVTLLSDAPLYGPWSADPEYQDWMGERELFDAFADYPAPEGWYFQGEYADCSELGRFEWSYYPPERFLVLIYLPDSGEYLCSAQPALRYAFDSSFTAAVSGGRLTVTRSYDLGPVLWGLAVRVAATIAIELAVGWLLFGLRGRGALRVILCTNAVTQLGLNLLLNLYAWFFGSFGLTLLYAAAELAVFAAEAAVYRRHLPRPRGAKPRPVLYALTANLVSFGAGLWLAHLLPGVL